MRVKQKSQNQDFVQGKEKKPSLCLAINKTKGGNYFG